MEKQEQPNQTTDAIMAARMTAIEAMVSYIHQWIASHDDPMRVQCKYKQECCDGFVLGHLIREFKKLGLYPEVPSTHNLSVEEIRDKIASVKYPEFVFFDDISVNGCCDRPQRCICKLPRCYYCMNNNCKRCNVSHIPGTPKINHARCGPVGSFAEVVTDIITKIEGLEYSRFVGKRKSEGNNGPNIEANADMWDCLKYI